jgi:hypothetical protein
VQEGQIRPFLSHDHPPGRSHPLSLPNRRINH